MCDITYVNKNLPWIFPIVPSNFGVLEAPCAHVRSPASEAGPAGRSSLHGGFDAPRTATGELKAFRHSAPMEIFEASFATIVWTYDSSTANADTEICLDQGTPNCPLIRSLFTSAVGRLDCPSHVGVIMFAHFPNPTPTNLWWLKPPVTRALRARIALGC